MNDYIQSLQRLIDQQRMLNPSHRDSEYRSRLAFLGVAGLCLLQMILMLSFTFFFLSSNDVAARLYGQLAWLGNYSPLLIKYLVATGAGRVPFEPAVVFSIYFSFLAVQAIVIPLILAVFFKSLPSRVRFHFSKENISFLVLALCALICPLWDMLIGPSDIRNPNVFSNRIFYGNVGSAFVEYCVMMPWFNFALFAIIYTIPRNRP